MKTTAFLIAVLAVLGVVVVGDPAIAGTILTNTSTLGSTSFGFEPTAGNLQAFTRQTDPASTYCTNNTCTTTAVQTPAGDGLACGPIAGGLSCVSGNYIPLANSLPGALTSRPDKVVSTFTDFGCGDAVPTGAACVEGPPSTGINTLTRVINAEGHNTAPLPSQCGALPCPADGTLTGALHSVVALENLGTVEMPSGSIVFDWTPGVIAGVGGARDNNGSATFTVDISHVVSGLYTFNEHDTTLVPVLTYASRVFEGNLPENANGVADAGEDLGENFGELYPTMEENEIRTTLDLTQITFGGTGSNTETIGYTVDWGPRIGHPAGGAYFTPGLNIRDWNGNPTPIPAPNPPGDGAGFAN